MKGRSVNEHAVNGRRRWVALEERRSSDEFTNSPAASWQPIAS